MPQHTRFVYWRGGVSIDATNVANWSLSEDPTYIVPPTTIGIHDVLWIGHSFTAPTYSPTFPAGSSGEFAGFMFPKDDGATIVSFPASATSVWQFADNPANRNVYYCPLSYGNNFTYSYLYGISTTGFPHFVEGPPPSQEADDVYVFCSTDPSVRDWGPILGQYAYAEFYGFRYDGPLAASGGTIPLLQITEPCFTQTYNADPATPLANDEEITLYFVDYWNARDGADAWNYWTQPAGNGDGFPGQIYGGQSDFGNPDARVRLHVGQGDLRTGIVEFYNAGPLIAKGGALFVVDELNGPITFVGIFAYGGRRFGAFDFPGVSRLWFSPSEFSDSIADPSNWYTDDALTTPAGRVPNNMDVAHFNAPAHTGNGVMGTYYSTDADIGPFGGLVIEDQGAGLNLQRSLNVDPSAIYGGGGGGGLPVYYWNPQSGNTAMHDSANWTENQDGTGANPAAGLLTTPGTQVELRFDGTGSFARDDSVLPNDAYLYCRKFIVPAEAGWDANKIRTEADNTLNLISEIHCTSDDGGDPPVFSLFVELGTTLNGWVVLDSGDDNGHCVADFVARGSESFNNPIRCRGISVRGQSATITVADVVFGHNLNETGYWGVSSITGRDGTMPTIEWMADELALSRSFGVDHISDTDDRVSDCYFTTSPNNVGNIVDIEIWNRGTSPCSWFGYALTVPFNVYCNFESATANFVFTFPSDYNNPNLSFIWRASYRNPGAIDSVQVIVAGGENHFRGLEETYGPNYIDTLTEIGAGARVISQTFSAGIGSSYVNHELTMDAGSSIISQIVEIGVAPNHPDCKGWFGDDTSICAGHALRVGFGGWTGRPSLKLFAGTIYSGDRIATITSGMFAVFGVGEMATDMGGAVGAGSPVHWILETPSILNVEGLFTVANNCNMEFGNATINCGSLVWASGALAPDNESEGFLNVAGGSPVFPPHPWSVRNVNASGGLEIYAVGNTDGGGNENVRFSNPGPPPTGEKYCGAQFRLHVWNGAAFVPLSGERSSSGTITVESVDTSGKESRWRALTNCGTRAKAAQVSGLVTDHASVSACLAAAFNGTLLPIRLVAASGIFLDGTALVTSSERAGEYNGAESYSFGFELGAVAPG